VGLFGRSKLIFKAKAAAKVDEMENENMNETLDYSYQRQLDMLSKVRRGVADIATSRKQVEGQINDLQSQADDLKSQAEKAVSLDRDDLAREALARRAGILQQISDLNIQFTHLQAEEEKLIKTSSTLQTRVEQFRIKKETLKASHSAAMAQNQIHEAFTGIGGEFSDIAMALTRAEDKTAEMQARSEAVGELVSSGAFDNGTDWIEAELNSVSQVDTVENELNSLKSAKALPAGKN
jgi:phage shock protein A